MPDPRMTARSVQRLRAGVRAAAAAIPGRFRSPSGHIRWTHWARHWGVWNGWAK
jgi:hypothetical protein